MKRTCSLILHLVCIIQSGFNIELPRLTKAMLTVLSLTLIGFTSFAMAALSIPAVPVLDAAPGVYAPLVTTLVTTEAFDHAISKRVIPANIYRSETASKTTVTNLSAARVGGDSSALGPASIAELARALRNDPDLIYQYVRNNIEFYPAWGIQKGAVGTLLDNQGTDFDQATLMVRLLNASGYSASYVRGRITLNAQQIKEWFGRDITSSCALQKILSLGQIPTNSIIPSPSCTTPVALTSATFEHIWVKVNIGGTNYVFDPSYKPHKIVSGIDLNAASGYSPATYLSSAMTGATETADFVQSVNRTNIRNNLTTYSNTFASWLRTNKPAASLDDVLGGATIVPIGVTPLRQTSLPYQTSTFTPIDIATVPDTYRVTLRVQVPGIDQSFFMDDIYGKRLTITYNASNQPLLKLEGVQLGVAGTAGTAGTQQGVTMTVTHNAYVTLSLNQTFTKGVLNGGTFLIANSVGPVGRGLSLKYREVLKDKIAAGVAADDESVLGSSLGVMAGQWMAQSTFVAYITGKLSDSVLLHHHQVGIAGWYNSSYIDLPGIVIAVTNNAGDVAKESAAFTSYAMHSSILESTAVTQTTATSAVSTVKLLDRAVELGQAIYTTTSANYTTAVQPNLTGCSATQLSKYLSIVNAATTNRIILPKSCSIVEGTFTGYGYYRLETINNNMGFGNIITGGLFGGLSTVPMTRAITSTSVARYTPPSSFGARGSPAQILPTNLGKINYFGDPIDMVSGNYIYTHDDMSVGVGAQSLLFTRLYSSGLNTEDGQLGKGWTHNYDITVAVGSDGYQGLGEDSALDAVGTLIEQKISYDLLLSDPARPVGKMVIATLGQRWFGEQLTNNTVMVKQGLSGELYVKLPDGSYNPPPGKPSRLTLAAGIYTHETVNKAKLTFNLSTAINGANKAASYSDPNGLTINYTYTGANLTSVANSVGRVLTFTNTANRITQIADGNTRTVKYVYDASGSLTTYTNSLLNNTTYQYDIPGRMTKLFYPSFPTIAAATNVYDTLSRVQTQTNAMGNLYNYYFAGSRSEEVGPGGKSLVSYADNLGNVIKSIDPIGRTTLNTYDAHSRIIKEQLPEGNYVEYTYDDTTCASVDKRCTHNVKTVVATPKPGSGLTPLTQSYTYESAFNKVATATDARGNVTNYTYTTFGSPLTVTSPTDVSGVSPVTSFTYTAFTPTAAGFTTFPFNLPTGQTVKTNATNVVASAATYNTAALKFVPLTTVQDSGAGKLNITNTFTYDAIGNLTLANGPRTDVTDTVTIAYDAARQPITITDGLTKQARITYDADGRVITSAKQLGAAWLVSCSTYTATGKPLKTWGPAQTAAATTCPAQAAPVAVADYTYDTLDRNSTVTQNLAAADGGNRVSQVNYNLDDTVQSTQRAVGTPLAQTYATYTYTQNGQQATAADAKNNLTTYSYDGFDRAVQVNYPSPTSANTSSTTDFSQAVYDQNSNVISTRTRKGTVITHTYDNLNRLTARTYPNAADNLTFSYDLRGLKTASQYANGSNTVTYNWDNAGRLLTTSSAGRTLSYAYDLASNGTQTTWPDAYLTTTSYDALNRPLLIKEGNAASTVNLASYAYDDLSRRTTTTLGNGTSTAYTYDTQANLGSIQHSLNSLAQDVRFDYSRNQLQEIKQINTSNSAYIHSAFVPTTSTYLSNGLNQYASQTLNAANLPYAYDTNGNLSSETTSAGSTTRSFDEDNRMVAQSLGTAALTYDAASRLSKTIINGVETQLLYDGSNLVAEYNSAGTLLKRYVHSNGIDEPIVVYNDASTTNKNWLYADHLGSIVALANTTGAATANYTYSAEGKQGGSTATRFGYTGQQNLSGLGVQYYKARMYSADLGRFIQTDPIGMADDMNLYAYVGNDSVNGSDPSGLAGVALGRLGSSLKSDFGQSFASIRNTDLSFGGMMDGLNSLGPVGVEMGVALKGIGMLGATLKGVRGGETAATIAGREAHKAYETTLGGAYDFNKALPSGKRPDAIDYVNNVVRELKPNSETGISRGVKQLQGYVDELEAFTKQKWQGFLDTYNKR